MYRPTVGRSSKKIIFFALKYRKQGKNVLQPADNKASGGKVSHLESRKRGMRLIFSLCGCFCLAPSLRLASPGPFNHEPHEKHEQGSIQPPQKSSFSVSWAFFVPFVAQKSFLSPFKPFAGLKA
ncbi:hypothetical protein [Desulfoluna sp.]|uniref:hypothetical protein n=1 Tax=Desulfoluna sp. TaxID=2045199 RepID=UPI0026207B84|nr:hypothetical protein [Desulfoluna sp.]